MMAQVKPKVSKDQIENENHTSTKRPNDIKLEGIKRNKGYFHELGKPSSPKRPKDTKYSSASDKVLDTIKDKTHFIDNIDFGNNPIEVRFKSSYNIDPDELGHVIATDDQKPSHADCVLTNSIKKKDLQKNGDFFTIKFEKDYPYKTLETEINELVELCAKDFEDEAPGAETERVISVGKDIATDWPLGKISV